MLARYLTGSVPNAVRAKGLRYHHQGAVVAISGGEWSVHAVVRGGRNYRVEIVRDHDTFRATCDCAYFTDRGEICKHIWAAIMEADERGLLAGDGVMSDEAFLQADLHQTDRRRRPNVPMPLQKAQPPAWQRFLTDLHGRIEAGERPLPVRRFLDGEILYTVDVAQSQVGRGLVLHVLHRQRKKNGEWAKPKPAAVTANEVESLPIATDREIHTNLLGAVDQSVFQSSYYGQVQAERATYLLVSATVDRLLPHLVSTGRLYLAIERGQPEAEPLVWDDGPPWEFQLSIAEGDGSSIRVSGELQRGDERMPLSEPVLILESGFLFTHHSVARFEPGDARAWVSELRRTSSVTFPASATDALAEALARAGVRPERLPERLRYEVQSPAMQPSVTLARASGRFSDAYRDTLSAHVRFDYGGTLVDQSGGSGVYDAASRRLVRRDLAAEQRAFNRLRQLEQADAQHRRRSLSARRPRARDGRLARRGGRAPVPCTPRDADARRVWRGLVRAARPRRFRRRRQREPARLAFGAPSRRGDGSPGRRHARPRARGVAAALRRRRAVRRGGRRSREVQAIADGVARRAARDTAGRRGG
jgi:hypothetical protein